MTFKAKLAQEWIKRKGLPALPCNYESIEEFNVIHIKTIEDFESIQNLQSIVERFTGSAVDSKNLQMVYVLVDSTWIELKRGERYESNYAYETPIYRNGEKLIDFITNHVLFAPWYIVTYEKGYSYIEGQEDYDWERLTIHVVHIDSMDIVNYYLQGVENL